MLCELVFSVTIAVLYVTEAAVHLQDLQQDFTVDATSDEKADFFLAFFLMGGGVGWVRLYFIYENIFQND